MYKNIKKNNNRRKILGGSEEINQNWYSYDIHYTMLKDYNRMNCYYNFIRKNKWLKNKICCDLGAGTGIFNTIAFIGRGLYRTLKGERIPNDVVNKMNAMLEKAQKEANTTLKVGEVPDFKPTLGQKYKSPELIQIAKGMGLPLDKEGKKKVKKELYDDINFYQLNL